MDILDLIERKQRGESHSPQIIRRLVASFTAGAVPDYQMAAWLMAVKFRGLDISETVALTRACVESGRLFEWPGGGGPVVDKHSTGGVGDKTSLVVVPLAAACGLRIPKLSGRGLGKTGGTLDKLESIPGFRVRLEPDQFVRQVQEVGAAIASQTAGFVPADGAIYALRDATGTVDSPSLIAASVMSKKLAAGADTIVLDVKVGVGAFCATYEDGLRLAELMVELGRREGKKVRAILTAMEWPLGHAIGHSLEVMEALQTLRGEGPADVTELALTLTAALIRDSGLRPAPRAARERAEKSLRSGAAEAKFREILAAQGGDLQGFEAAADRAWPGVKLPFVADRRGRIQKIDAGRVAAALKALGGARTKKGNDLDRGVGILLMKKPGEMVQAGEEIAFLLARSESQGLAARKHLEAGAAIADGEPQSHSPILGQVGG